MRLLHCIDLFAPPSLLLYYTSPPNYAPSPPPCWPTHLYHISQGRERLVDVLSLLQPVTLWAKAREGEGRESNCEGRSCAQPLTPTVPGSHYISNCAPAPRSCSAACAPTCPHLLVHTTHLRPGLAQPLTPRKVNQVQLATHDSACMGGR